MKSTKIIKKELQSIKLALKKYICYSSLGEGFITKRNPLMQ